MKPGSFFRIEGLPKTGTPVGESDRCEYCSVHHSSRFPADLSRPPGAVIPAPFRILRRSLVSTTCFYPPVDRLEMRDFVHWERDPSGVERNGRLGE